MSPRSKSCLIGIADHQGVMNVGGRIGAASGPEAFRRIFYKFKDRSNLLERIEDAGDVLPVSTQVEKNHQAASEKVAKHHRASGVSVIVGGGHDHGYSHLVGIQKALGLKKGRLGCINIDAHLDVRKPAPEIGSGSPFYLALEARVLTEKTFIEFGIQDHCNAPELWKYVKDKKVKVIPFTQLRGGLAVKKFQAALKTLAKNCDAIVVSWDLDSSPEANAPGVSAPQSEGFLPRELIEMMEIAGREKKVVSLGIFELNPHHDEHDKTARLAATGAFHFLLNKEPSR